LPKIDRVTLPSYPFWGLLIALIALFFMGGSSRADVQSLAILNPAMILCCGVAFLTLKKEHKTDKKWFYAGFAMIFILHLLYLIPALVQFLTLSQGTSELNVIKSAADASSAIHPIVAAPVAVWQSVAFLFAPLAVFLFAIQINRDDLRHVLLIAILFGVISGIIGVLQIAGSANGPLYLYRITNSGSAVGLYANRNHAAVFLACLFPMLAVFAARSHASDRKNKNTLKWLAMAVAVILVPLILVTGSRSGMLAAIVGLIGGVLVHNSHVLRYNGPNAKSALFPIAAAMILVGLVFATIYFSRAEAIERMFAEPAGAIDRAEFWTSSLKLFWQYFPYGYGPGSFVQAFQKEEPLALLNGAYLNQLHNDWLETALTFGVPGILLMLSGVVYYVRRSFLLWFRMDGARSAVALGRMASVIFAILGIASMSDYPLRTPAMMGFAALVLIWFTEAGGARKVKADNPG
jgi:hypothetical protein